MGVLIDQLHAKLIKRPDSIIFDDLQEPKMPVAAGLAYALQLLNMLPQLIATGQSAMTLINQGTSAVQNMIAEKRGPTDEEWAALNTMRDTLHKEVQK